MPDTTVKGEPSPGRNGLSRLGVAFWVSLAWIVCLIASTATVEFWNLPEPDHMDWLNLASEPGTLGKIPITGHGDGPVERDYPYLLGTDTMGRDIVTRLIYGARISLSVGLIAPIIGMVLGGFLGMLAGYYRGRLETFVVSGMDTILAFPGIVLLLAMSFYLGASLQNLIIVLGFLTIPAFSRVARAQTLTFSQREFVQAAKMLGQRDAGILLREILPNVFMSMLVYALLVVSGLIIAEGALSYLGLSVPPPTPSWGGMIAEGKEVLDEAPHVSLIPAFVMFLTVISFNLIGDSLRKRIDARESHI